MTVFANGLEISSKKQGCQVIAAFPDPCFTPPQTPATPPGVPLPYPNFGKDSDLTSGSGTVKIGGETISQENSSKYSKCTGDEAGCAPKKGVLTSKNTGAMYAQKWSQDVKVEGKGVARFGDIATSNHASNGTNSAMNVLVGTPGHPGFYESPHCLVGQYGVIAKKCSDRGGGAHHIIPDEYLRDVPKDLLDKYPKKTPREIAETVAKEAKKNGTPDETRLDDSFPRIDQGCCICVGGNANGSSAREAKPPTEVGRSNRRAVLKKARTHAKRYGTKNLADMRGHGFLHKFDHTFRKLSPTVNNALKTANKLLDQSVRNPSTGVTAKCAEKAKECIKKQFAAAKKKKGAKLNKFDPVSEEAEKAHLSRLRR